VEEVSLTATGNSIAATEPEACQLLNYVSAAKRAGVKIAHETGAVRSSFSSSSCASSRGFLPAARYRRFRIFSGIVASSGKTRAG